MAWKNVTFLSRIKRNREISIQFRVSARGKRCKFLNFLTARMSNHRCSDKIGYKFGSARIIARFRKQGFSRVAQRNLLFLFFIYLFIRLYRSDESREESRRNFQRDWKYLGRENSLLRQRFEDAYSRLASICVLSFRSTFSVGENIDGNAWRTFPNALLPNSVKLFQTWKTSVNNFHIVSMRTHQPAEHIRTYSKSISFLVYRPHFSHYVSLQLLFSRPHRVLHFDVTRTIFHSNFAPNISLLSFESWIIQSVLNIILNS